MMIGSFKIIMGFCLLLSFLLGSFTVGKGVETKPLVLSPKDPGGTGRSEKPLRVTSQQLEADHKNGVITFIGNVIARQGEMIIHADQAQVFYLKKDEGNEIKEIVAIGNVKFQEGDRVATGQKAIFYNDQQKVILTGQPKVWQGKDMVSGDKITVFLNEDKSIVEGGPGQRVEVILYPKPAPPGKGQP